MRSTTDIVFGVTGQSLAYRVPQGRATSATFKVFDAFADDDATADFSGSATVDSVTTTLTATSGDGTTDATKVNLSTTSIVIGKQYLLAEGQRNEWVEPVQVETGYFYARHPLKGSYTTAATFVGTTITAAVDATWVAATANLSDHMDQNPSYRVRWEVLVGSSTYVSYTYFDLVRAAVTHQVDADDINTRAPGYFDQIPIEYRAEQGRPVIDSAWRSAQADLTRLQIDTDAIRDDQFLDELVIRRTLCVLAMGGWRPAGFASVNEYIEATTTSYDRFLEQHVQATLTHKLATGSGGGAEIVAPKAYWSK